MTAELTKSFSDEDVDSFARLSGDINPVHLDENYAKETIFGARIVHGALVSSIFSTIFANNLPGAGCIYLKSENKFLKPVYLNEPVRFKVEISEVIKEKKRVIFKTSAISKDVECIVGTAELYIPD
uniref:WahO n=2 Tax=Moraxellaceae TaxID=468 RepID=V5RBG3_ACINO|nr:WahO [Acinetobacter nosocomialis]